MINIKNYYEMERMREGGKISKKVLDYGLRLCVTGISTLEIDTKISNKIAQFGAEAWFKEVDDYKYSTCIAVNDEWIHGIPKDRKLKKGDVVSIDLGIKYDGFYIDNCWTCVVQGDSPSDNVRHQFKHDNPKVEKFLTEGVKCFYNSIKQAKIGGRVGDISFVMGECTKFKGYSVIDDYTGHGIGKFYHEEPAIPCYGISGDGQLLKKGMVLAIELMYTMGDHEHTVAEDGWTVITRDGAISAMFEHTVALYNSNTIILTL